MRASIAQLRRGVERLMTQRVSVYHQTRSRPSGTGYHAQGYAAEPDRADVKCKISQPSAREVERARTHDVDHMTMIYFPSGTDVRRHDKIAVTESPVPEHVGLELFVLALVSPSEPVYIRADCERIEES